MAEPRQQARWGQWYQQQSLTGPDTQSHQQPVGWQQQSKWRRKVTQGQSTLAQIVVNVDFAAQVNVAALAPTVVIAGPPWQQQSKWRRKVTQGQSTPAPTVPVVVNLTTAQVNVAALPITVVFGSPPWQQQSRWHRKVTQGQSTLSQIVVNVDTAAQVNVAALAPTIQIISPPPLQPQYPQARWGQRLQQLPTVPSTIVVVNLPTAQVNVSAPAPILVTSARFFEGWKQQSKWRRKVQQPHTFVRPPTYGGFGDSGLITVTYADPTTYLMEYSVSGLAGVDQFGNAFPVGYQGPIGTVQPGGANPGVTEPWHALALTANAAASGNGVNGFFYRLTGENEVELLWDIELLATSGAIGILPAHYRPILDINMPSGWYGTGPAAYNDAFSPHWLIRGRTGSVPGQIVMEGFTTLDINMFGRDKFTLDVLLWVLPLIAAHQP